MNARTVSVLTALLLAAVPQPALAQQGTAEAVPVTVTEVASESMSPVVPVAGTVFSRRATQITAGLTERIAWIAEPGDEIAAGDPVVRFECGLLRLRREEQLAEVERERISLATLTRETGRLEALRETLAASETQLDRIRGDRDLAAATLRIARVRVRQTETELERCVATAPFSGVVTERFRTAGEDVERSTVLAAMTDTRNLEVRASVPIRHLPRIRAGGTAEVRLNELRFDGRIRKAVPAADPLSQTFEVRIELPDAAPAYVAAGQLVSVSLPLAPASALTVPRDSIVLREDGAFVMRITPENTVERVPIEVADAAGQRIAIRGGLRAGDRIAVRGAESLDEGRRVAVRSET